MISIFINFHEWIFLECCKNVPSAWTSVRMCSTNYGMALTVVALNVKLNLILEKEYQGIIVDILASNGSLLLFDTFHSFMILDLFSTFSQIFHALAFKININTGEEWVQCRNKSVILKSVSVDALPIQFLRGEKKIMSQHVGFFFSKSSSPPFPRLLECTPQRRRRQCWRTLTGEPVGPVGGGGGQFPRGGQGRAGGPHRPAAEGAGSQAGEDRVHGGSHKAAGGRDPQKDQVSETERERKTGRRGLTSLVAGKLEGK